MMGMCGFLILEAVFFPCDVCISTVLVLLTMMITRTKRFDIRCQVVRGLNQQKSVFS